MAKIVLHIPRQVQCLFNSVGYIVNQNMCDRKIQEAQLSQRDRAMLRAIGYFAKSLKVIRNDIIE